MSFHRIALLSTVMFAPACLTEGEPAPSDLDALVGIEERCFGCDWGPPVTNTHGLNGLYLSALDTTGEKHDGWQLLSVEIMLDRSLVPVYGVHVEDGILYGHDALNNQYSGAAFVESVWTVELEQTDEVVEMSIDSFTPSPSAARYTFVGGNGSIPNDDKGFTCDIDPETEEYSVVLFQDLDVDPQTGTHLQRPNTIYFGCLSGSVGKAAMWGYSPWNADDDGHQAASRAVRADFCGDGTSYTIEGTPLQVSDVYDIRHFSKEEKATEALWGPAGAECIKVPRRGQDPQSISCGGVSLPICSGDDTFEDWPQAILWSKIWE